jgi:hypothetical protein
MKNTENDTRPADSLRQLVVPLRCPHGNRPTGNWCGCPPESKWEAKLRCCGRAFVADSPEEALAKFDEWANIQKTPQADASTVAAMDKMRALLRKKELIRTGHAGVNADGRVVDIREHPQAIPLQRHNDPIQARAAQDAH